MANIDRLVVWACGLWDCGKAGFTSTSEQAISAPDAGHSAPELCARAAPLCLCLRVAARAACSLVSDVNDEEPRWRQPVYNVSVAEDAPANATLLVVEALDADSGANGRVRYALTATSGACDPK